MTLEQRAEALRDEMELAFVDPRTTIGQIDKVIERHLLAVVEACAEMAERTTIVLDSTPNWEYTVQCTKAAQQIRHEVGR